MAQIIQKIKLEVAKPNEFKTLLAKQGDSSSRFLNVTLVNDGTKIPIEASSVVKINATRPDGEADGFIGTANGDGTATVPVHSWILAVEGKVECDIAVTDSAGRKLSSISFVINVEATANKNGTTSGEKQAEPGELDAFLVAVSEQVENISKKVDNAINAMSNALKGSSEGNVVLIDDVSPIEHTVKVKVRRKRNLIPFPYYAKSITANGVTVTVNTDGTITLNGTSTGPVGFALFVGRIPLSGKYTLSGVNNAEGESSHYLQPYINGEHQTTVSSGARTYEFDGNLTQLSLFVRSGYTFNDVVVSPQLEAGMIATEYEPSIDPTAVTVTRCGKNFLATNEIEIAKNQAWTNENIGKVKIAPGNYVASCYFKQVGATKSYVQLSPRSYNDYTVILGNASSTETEGKLVVPFTVKDEHSGFQMYVYSNATAESIATDCLFTKIMVETGDKATEFEAYKGSAHQTETDGTVDGVKSVYPTMTLFADKENVSLDVEYNKDANKVISDLMLLIQQGGVGRIAYMDLLASKWQGSESLYSQVVSIAGVTEYSKIDINPSIEQLAIFHQKDISFVAENEDGVVTVYCVGQKPVADYQMQITITEVLANV